MSVNFKKYQQNARDIEALLERFPDYCPTMRMYNSKERIERGVEHVCGTHMCLAGLQAHMEDYPEDYITSSRFMYDEFSYDKAGLDMPELKTSTDPEFILWSYIYGPTWPDSREDAFRRIDVILSYNNVNDLLETIKEEFSL